MLKLIKQDLVYNNLDMGKVITEPTKGSLIIIQSYNLIKYKFPHLKGCLEIDTANIDNINIPSIVSGDIYLTNCHVNNIRLPNIKGYLILDKCIISKAFIYPKVGSGIIIR